MANAETVIDALPLFFNLRRTFLAFFFESVSLTVVAVLATTDWLRAVLVILLADFLALFRFAFESLTAPVTLTVAASLTVTVIASFFSFCFAPPVIVRVG